MQRQEMEAAGGLVEWLDVKLTEREEQHQHALHEIERQLAERDQRIHELEQIHEQLRKQVADTEALHASATQTVEQQIDKAA
jgi:signal recognition particle GTPase